MSDKIGFGGGHDFSFGNSKAAIALAKMLAENPKEEKKTGRLLGNYFYLLGVLQGVQDPEARKFLLLVLRNYYASTLGPIEPGKKTIKSLTWNLIVTAYREAVGKAQKEKNKARIADSCSSSPLAFDLWPVGEDWYDINVKVQQAGKDFCIRLGSQPTSDKAKRFGKLWVKQAIV